MALVKKSSPMNTIWDQRLSKAPATPAPKLGSRLPSLLKRA